jgi:hypothetical protein
MERWLSTDSFWDVSDCQVYWVCLLVPEKCKLCLVRRYNQGDDCSPCLTSLEAFLKMVIR